MSDLKNQTHPNYGNRTNLLHAMMSMPGMTPSWGEVGPKTVPLLIMMSYALDRSLLPQAPHVRALLA